MRHRSIPLALLVPVLAGCVTGCGGTRPGDSSRPEPPSASYTLPEADLEPFRYALHPYGEWHDSRSLGTVWIPYGTPAGWRPYTSGRWLSTNHGWMWVGDEPWAWAAYHYGRWIHDEDLGWVWFPGNTWAPAWVAWRYGQGYIGWAPLAPGVDWTREGSRDEALSRGVDPFAWSFVRARDFTARSLLPRIVPVGRNPTLVSLTSAAGRYAASGSRVAERGFSESGAVERPVRYRVVDAGRPRQNRAPIVQGSAVEIYRPEALKGQAPSGRSSLTPGSRILDLAERERREQERFAERMAQERERLRQEQERERRLRPESMSQEKLLRRQKKETEAQQAFEERERAIFEQRRERLRAEPEPSR